MSCKKNWVLNPKTGRCIKKDGITAKKVGLNNTLSKKFEDLKNKLRDKFIEKEWYEKKEWKKKCFEKNPYKPNKYIIHDNGLRPFLVHINNGYVDIYKKKKKYNNKQLENMINLEEIFTVFVKRYNPMKIFIGKDPYEGCNGNTILLKISPKKYVSISLYIHEFSVPDEITEYYSLLGNNDSPYPVAFSKNNIYFIADYVYINRKDFPVTFLNTKHKSAAYSEYYKNEKKIKPFLKDIKKNKVIHKRINF